MAIKRYWVVLAATVLLAQSAMAHMGLLYPMGRGSIGDRKQFDNEAHAFIDYDKKRTLPCNGYNKVGPITKLRAGQIVNVSLCIKQLLVSKSKQHPSPKVPFANMSLVPLSFLVFFYLPSKMSDTILGACSKGQIQLPSAIKARQKWSTDQSSAPRWRLLPILAELRRWEVVPFDWGVQRVVSGFLLRVAGQDPRQCAEL
jgi:hypothetical protein